MKKILIVVGIGLIAACNQNDAKPTASASTDAAAPVAPVVIQASLLPFNG
jgi:hypothetical protein